MGLEGDAENSALYQDFTSACVVRSVSGTTAKTAALSTGRHRIVCDVACFISQEPQASAVATANDHYLPADTVDYIFVCDANDTVAAITAGATGNLYISLQSAG